jgi:hypothetical protein
MTARRKSARSKARPKPRPRAKAKPRAKAPAKRKPAASRGPKPVKTGRGATPLEVAQTVAALLRRGAAHEVEQQWLAPGIESVEGVGASVAWKGKKAVLDKYRAWEATHEIHDMRVDGPWVGATGFSLKYWIDVTDTSSGQRSQFEEIAVYTVQDGKIIREEFHFAVGG